MITVDVTMHLLDQERLHWMWQCICWIRKDYSGCDNAFVGWGKITVDVTMHLLDEERLQWMWQCICWIRKDYSGCDNAFVG